MNTQKMPLKNSLCLLLAATIWGIAFVAQSVGMEYVVIGLAAALLLALILVIVALVKVGKLKKRYEKFLSGKDGKSLEESIVKRFDKLNEIIVEQDFLEQEIQRIDEEHKSSFSKMEVYKYNAFSDMGGELSLIHI